MKPEEKLAARLLERHNLTPPYNLEELASQYADIGFLRFPVEADGVSLGLKQVDKPKIYINSLRPLVRRRFTLAHELGHVIIPWHIGNIVSHTDFVDCEQEINIAYRGKDYEYQQIEGEANRFAAELLIPTSWLNNFFREVETSIFKEILVEVMEQSGSSKDTTLIKTFSVLPPGYTCVEIDHESKVINSFVSPNTQVYKLGLGADCSSDNYLVFKDKTFFSLGERNYILWSFENSMEPPNESLALTWREVLNIIFEDTGLQDKKQSINAILPSRFQSVKDRSDSEVFACIIHRYSERGDLENFVQHPLFEQYVVKRLKELRQKYPRQC